MNNLSCPVLVFSEYMQSISDWSIPQIHVRHHIYRIPCMALRSLEPLDRYVLSLCDLESFDSNSQTMEEKAVGTSPL